MFRGFVLRALRHNFKRNKIILAEALRLRVFGQCDNIFNETQKQAQMPRYAHRSER